VKEG
jgi:hypothetical protein